MASFVPEHDNIVETVILEIAHQHFEIVRARDGRVTSVVGAERAIDIPQQAKAPPLLDHEKTAPTFMVCIDHSDRTGEIRRAIAQDPFGRINKPDADSVFLRLLQFERHSGLGVLAPLERGGAHRGPFGVGLMLLKLLFRLILPSRPEERLGQLVMRRRVEMIWVHPNTFLERGDGSIPLPQSHPGHSQLKRCRRLSGINLLRVFQGFRRFLRVRQTKIGRPFDKVSRR